MRGYVGMDWGQMPAKPIRVLIAEDSPTIRYYLKDMIGAAPSLEVAAIARDGQEAVALTHAIDPDVVSMDVQMPVMDGLEATRLIMRHTPKPVVVVSGLVEREIDLSFRALQSGALAVLPKPPARESAEYDEYRRRLWNTLQAMAGVRVIRRWASAYEVPKHEPQRYDTHRLRHSPELIAIASSAGGPSALVQLLGALRHVDVPIVVVQHMPGEFLGGLVRWLRKFTDMPIRIAVDNDILTGGMVHLAPANAHLRVMRRDGWFVAQLDPERGGYRHQPAADVLFESVATVTGERGVGIVLTGMGSDGAEGLLAMRRLGARTFAQDEASCTVFGMPAAAIECGAAERVMSPLQMAETLRQLL